MPRPIALHWDVPATEGAPTQGSTAGNVKTTVFHCRAKRAQSLDIAWTGTTAGTLTIYASNSHNPGDTGLLASRWNGNWTSINSLIVPTITNPAGSANNIYLDLGGLSSAYIYVDFARSAGSGVITAHYNWED